MLLLIISALFNAIPLYFPSLFFLSWFSFVPIFFLLERIDINKSYKLGWLFGFIFISFSGYWLIYPMINFSGLTKISSVFILIILFSFIALFYALWAYVFKKIGMGAVRGALSWTAIEYLRYKFFSVFPIAFLGYTQHKFKPLLQWADLGGVFLITFLVMLINGYFYKLFKRKEKKYIVMLFIIFLLINVYGGLRINTYHVDDLKSELNVALLQTTISQKEKWLSHRIDDNIDDIFSKMKEVKNVKLVITPETGLTFDLVRNEYYRNKVINLITQEEKYFQLGSQSIIEGSNEKYNSVFLLSPEGKILARYNKNNLVPFGETMPLNNLINYLTGKKWYSLTAGEEAQLFKINSIKWRNLICSEILYPQFKKDPTAIDFIVNQSNEAWFNNGLQQQIWTAAVFRAVESRKMVLRTGNYSYSGVINMAGFVKRKKDVKSSEPITAKIISSHDDTIYNRCGNYIGYISLLFVLAMYLFAFLKK